MTVKELITELVNHNMNSEVLIEARWPSVAGKNKAVQVDYEIDGDHQTYVIITDYIEAKYETLRG